jgi:hypothetical protein
LKIFCTIFFSQKQTYAKLVKSARIRQKLGVRKKYFLPARQLSNPPELSISGGENRHLATLLQAFVTRQGLANLIG